MSALSAVAVGQDVDAAGMQKTRKVDARGPDAERLARDLGDPEIIIAHVTWNQRGRLMSRVGLSSVGAGSCFVGVADVDSLEYTFRLLPIIDSDSLGIWDFSLTVR